MKYLEGKVPEWAQDPSDFVSRLPNLEEGWSRGFGGPLGVAQHAVNLQQQQVRISEEIASVRAAAIEEAAKTVPKQDIARTLGISRQAVEKARGRKQWPDARW